MFAATADMLAAFDRGELAPEDFSGVLKALS